MTERKFKVGDIIQDRKFKDQGSATVIEVNDSSYIIDFFGKKLRTSHKSIENDCDLVLRPEKISPHYTKGAEGKPKGLSALYPKYYKDVSGVEEIDVYATHLLFGVEDASGAIQHASKKLLLSGVRTGGKSKFEDIREARDTLSRWLELNAPTDK